MAVNNRVSDEISNPEPKNVHTMEHRFRGYLPVVIDIETGGFNASTDAMLEIAATIIQMDDTGNVLSLIHI